MNFDLQREIQIFEARKEELIHRFSVQSLAPFLFRLRPRTTTPSSLKLVRLGFLALIHGDEVLGLPVLNELLRRLAEGEIETHCELYFGLGNLPAAKEGKRFLEEDLNRCFGLKNQNSLEAQRAREIEACMLDHCDYLLDLHQTGEEALDAFFIFQYSDLGNLALLKEINQGIPVVMQLDPIGDDSGLASDEYLRKRGGFGTTLELGQSGMNTRFFEQGLVVCEKLIRALNRKPRFEISDFDMEAKLPFPLFQMSYRFKISEEGMSLCPGWKNLQALEKDQLVGFCQKGDKRSDLFSPVAGRMIFPKYSAPRKIGQNLFYVCEAIENWSLLLCSRANPDS